MSCGRCQGTPFLPHIHYANDFLWQEAKNKCIQDKGDQSKQHLQRKKRIHYVRNIYFVEMKTTWLLFLITHWHTAALPQRPSWKRSTWVSGEISFLGGPSALLCDGRRAHKGTWKSNLLIRGRPWHGEFLGLEVRHFRRQRILVSASHWPSLQPV